MDRRSVILGGTLATAMAASPVRAASTTQVQLVRYRLKPGGLRNWENWSEEMKRRHLEVEETLRNEGTRTEACFLSHDGREVFYFWEVADIEKAEAAYASSQFPLDAEHKKRKDASLQMIESLRPLFSFKNG